MAHAWRALIIAPDDFPGKYHDYDAACRALNLEPNGHCYLVCRVTTAAGPRTLLTVDLALLPDIYEAGTSDQDSLPAIDRSEEGTSRTSAPDPDSDLPGGPPGRESRTVEELRLLQDPYRPEVYSAQPPRRPSGSSWGSPTRPAGPWRNPFEGFRSPASPYQRQPNLPHVQVVLDRDRATLKGLAVWNPSSRELGILAKADDAVKAAFRETVADTVATDIIDKLWPPPQAPPTGLADFDAALTALKAVLEPQTLLLKMINAAARVAATHAGLGVVAALIGQIRRKALQANTLARRGTELPWKSCPSSTSTCMPQPKSCQLRTHSAS